MLLEDIAWAKQQSQTETSPNHFCDLKDIVVISKCTLGEGMKFSSPPSSHSALVTGQTSSMIFENFEDEIYFQESQVSILCKSDEHNSLFVAMLVPIARLEFIIESIRSLTP